METRFALVEGSSGKTGVKVILATLLVIVCWAYSPIGIRIGLQAYEPGQLALVRFLIASVFMALVAIVKGISWPRLRDLPLLAVLGFCRQPASHRPQLRSAGRQRRGGQCAGPVHAVVQHAAGAFCLQGQGQWLAVGVCAVRLAWRWRGGRGGSWPG